MRHNKKDRKAFTLIELLVVIAIIALLVAILLPTLVAVRELGRRIKCANNVSSIGKALGIYVSEWGDWPIIIGTYNEWISQTAYTGVNRAVDPPLDWLYATAVPRNISSLLFMLIRQEGVEARHFNCPSDDDVSPDPNTKCTVTSLAGSRFDYAWDFTTAKNVSYSYACTYLMANAQ